MVSKGLMEEVISGGDKGQGGGGIGSVLKIYIILFYILRIIRITCVNYLIWLTKSLKYHRIISTIRVLIQIQGDLKGPPI